MSLAWGGDASDCLTDHTFEPMPVWQNAVRPTGRLGAGICVRQIKLAHTITQFVVMKVL